MTILLFTFLGFIIGYTVAGLIYPGRPRLCCFAALVCALLFMLVMLRYTISLITLLRLCMTVCLFMLALIDLKSQRLPDTLTQPLLWAGLIAADLDLSPLTLTQALNGVIIGYLLLYLPAQLFKLIRGYHGLGGGDIKLMAALGAWLHFSLLPAVLIIACSTALLTFILLKCQNKPISFGPHIALAGWLALLDNPFIMHKII